MTRISRVVPADFRRLPTKLKHYNSSNIDGVDQSRRRPVPPQEEEFHRPAPGYFDVYLWPERKRYPVPIPAANATALRELLDKYHGDYDLIPSGGPVSMLCSSAVFVDALRRSFDDMAPVVRYYYPDICHPF